MKLMNKDKEIAGVTKKVDRNSRKIRDDNGLQKLKQNSGFRESGNMAGKQREDKVVGSRAKCRKCGRIHEPKNCPAYGQVCRKCKKVNHWAKCCQTKLVQETTVTDEYLIEAISGDKIQSGNDKEATIILKINGKLVKGKIDTGAEVDVMPKRVFDQLSAGKNLKSLQKGQSKYT